MSIGERFPIANGLFHVTNRGVDRRSLVLDEQDRKTWLRLLGRNAARCGWRVFAFALLDNHFHLYLRTPHANLSTGMRDFESGYATLFNRRHDRDGHLFQSRFHAVIVENDGHSWELTRYVHLNSFRAGLTKDPFQDRWTSYRHYLNPDHAPPWLDWRTVLAEFGGTESQGRLAYKRFIESGIARPAPNPLEAAVDGWILGSEEFAAQCRAWCEKAETRATTVSVQQVLDAVAFALETPAEQIIRAGRHGNIGRDAAILLARELVAEPLEALADRFGGVSRSAITETARRARERAECEPSFAALLAEIRRQFGQ
ncbi:MAG: transposase [Planctomycetota bacterium]|nr:transposase [Planctomycetota bacterium]